MRHPDSARCPTREVPAPSDLYTRLERWCAWCKPQRFLSASLIERAPGMGAVERTHGMCDACELADRLRHGEAA